MKFKTQLRIVAVKLEAAAKWPSLSCSQSDLLEGWALKLRKLEAVSGVDDLLAACKAMASCAGDGSASFNTARKMARAAIAKTEDA